MRVLDYAAAKLSTTKTILLDGSPVAATRSSKEVIWLLVVELSTQSSIAATATAVLPLQLDQPIVGTEGLIVGALPERSGDGPELPGAFVRALVSGRVVPCA